MNNSKLHSEETTPEKTGRNELPDNSGVQSSGKKDVMKQRFRSALHRLDRMTHTWKRKKIKKITVRYPRNTQDMKVFAKELWHNGKKPILLLIGVFFLFLLLTPVFTYVYFVRDLSSKENIINRKNEGVILLDRNEKPFFTFYEARTKNSIPLSEIPEHTRQAVIAVEDKDFYKHPGFSIEGIGRAFVENIRNEEITQGGSTLTQQLVKNALLSQERSYLRKYQEVVLALEIERRFSKEDILEMYLNTVYFGEGAFGIQDAAQTYFSKDVSDLSVQESALLAGILPAPSAYSPLSGDLDRALARKDLVLSLMQKEGYIEVNELENLQSTEINFDPQPQTINVTAPHFALMVKEELIDKYGEQQVARSGYTVKTTLDLEGQEYAQQVVENQVARLARNNATNGAVVVEDVKTGEILALVGSHDWTDGDNGKINMALAARQPGSSFKPIVYAKGFAERELTPATKLDDRQIEFPGGYKPKNYDNKFRGEVTIRYALANSLNIPAVLALEQVGIQDSIEYAEDLGITTLKDPDRYGLSLVLGAAEVPLVEMTSAFAAFANQGEYVERTTILEIRNKKGKVIHTHEPKSRTGTSRQVSFLISSILSDNSSRADTFGGSLTISRPAAVKTGTTEEYRDALTIGYTPQIAVGAWVGNNDRTPMDNIAGSLGAAPIWRQVMEHFHQGKPVERFTPPPGVVKREMCTIVEKPEGENQENNDSDENEKSDENQPQIKVTSEYFIAGTAPKSNCITPTPTRPEDTPTPTEEPDPTEEPEEEPTPTPTAAPSPTQAQSPTSTPAPTQSIQLPPGLQNQDN